MIAVYELDSASAGLACSHQLRLVSALAPAPSKLQSLPGGMSNMIKTLRSGMVRAVSCQATFRSMTAAGVLLHTWRRLSDSVV